MGGYQNDAVGGHLGEQGAQAHALLGVKTGGGLVQNQQLGVAEQRRGQQQPLLHAAGIGGQALVQLGREIDRRSHAVNLGRDYFARQFFERGHVSEKPAAGVAVVQPLLLGHIPEHASEADAPRGLAAPEHLARIRRQRAGNDADQRALARAVRAKKAVEAGSEGEGDAGEGLLFAGVRVDLFTERRPTGRSLCVSFFEAVDG